MRSSVVIVQYALLIAQACSEMEWELLLKYAVHGEWVCEMHGKLLWNYYGVC